MLDPIEEGRNNQPMMTLCRSESINIYIDNKRINSSYDSDQTFLRKIILVEFLKF